jgi:hypothetical protein
VWPVSHLKRRPFSSSLKKASSGVSWIDFQVRLREIIADGTLVWRGAG